MYVIKGERIISTREFAGWHAWISFGEQQCRPANTLSAPYQERMLEVPFLTGSVQERDRGAENARVLFAGLGARTIANYIQYHLYKVNDFHFAKENLRSI